MPTVFIVEGVKDAEQIHNAFAGNSTFRTLVTEGTKFNNRLISELESWMQEEPCSVFILADPDLGGDHLTRMIHNVFPEIPRIEADKQECSYFTGKRFKQGIEHASYRYLRKLLSPILGLEYVEEEPIIWE